MSLLILATRNHKNFSIFDQIRIDYARKTIWYTQDIDKTQILYVIAQATIRGTDEVPYVDEQKFGSDAPFNNRGVKYPIVQSTRGDIQVAPFPDEPYVVCCSRDDNFRDNLTRLYNNNGWTIPNGGEAHHIKPLSWGGDNSMINGMFLSSPEHTRFSNWWLQFSNLNW